MGHKRDPELRHLVVIRHAKSSWDDPALADHDRPLSKRGRKALPKLRDHIEELELHPDLVICSDAVRTRQTLDGIRPAFGRHVRVELDAALYAADAQDLVAELKRLDDEVVTVFLIGHNPGAADLVGLLRRDSATGEPLLDRFPTGAVAVLSMDRPWNALQPGCASLDSLWSPPRPS